MTSRAMCIEVLTDDGTYTVDDERFSTRRVIGPSMLSLDGPAHRRHRSAFSPNFRAREVRESLDGWITDQLGVLLDEIEPQGEGDLRASLAAPLSVMVMARILGLESVRLKELSRWNEAITAAIDEVTVGRDVPQYGTEAFEELRSAVGSAMSGEGLLSEARDGGGLSLDEVAANVVVLLIGGVVTSDGTMSIALMHVLDRPDVRRSLIESPELIARAIEESMRLEPAAAFLDRYSTRDAVLGSADIRAGDLVRVSLSAANRDPATFDDPEEFRLDRENSEDHIAFARGPHSCLGFHVARLETTLAIRAVLERLPQVRSVPGDRVPPSGLIFRSPDRVPSVWAGESVNLS